MPPTALRLPADGGSSQSNAGPATPIGPPALGSAGVASDAMPVRTRATAAASLARSGAEEVVAAAGARRALIAAAVVLHEHQTQELRLEADAGTTDAYAPDTGTTDAYAPGAGTTDTGTTDADAIIDRLARRLAIEVLPQALDDEELDGWLQAHASPAVARSSSAARSAMAAAILAAVPAVRRCRVTHHPQGWCAFASTAGDDGCAEVLRAAHLLG